MNISEEDFRRATQHYISVGDQDAIWGKLTDDKSRAVSQFNLTNTMYYFGALIIISAMGWFMNLGWEQFGGKGIFVIAASYTICFYTAGWWLWHRRGLYVPGGLLTTVAVWMVPLAIYGLERHFNLWPHNNANISSYYLWERVCWLMMETGAILAGLCTLRFIKFTFLMFPIALSFWHTILNVAPLIFGKTDFTYHEYLWTSAVAGMLMLGIAFVLNRKYTQDFAFWGYLFGLAAFWGGLSLMETESELKLFGYCLVNVTLIASAVYLRRQAFAVFGAFGVFGYLGHLTWEIFPNSTAFPFVLTFIGLTIIAAGYLYQKNMQRIENFLASILPDMMMQLRPGER